LGYFSNYQKTAQIKHSASWQNFAQPGHPDPGLHRWPVPGSITDLKA
jgi:hypothetical protein